MWMSNGTWRNDGVRKVMEGLSGVNFTFVDLDAHGAADCVATIKLRHDKHATQRLSQ